MSIPPMLAALAVLIYTSTPVHAAPFYPEVKRLTAHLSSKYNVPSAKIKPIVEYAYNKQNQLSPTLLLAIIAKESSFKETATNSYGAVGLMQVVPRYHAQLLSQYGGPATLTNGPKNVEIGLQILSTYRQQKNNNLDAALNKYSGKASYVKSLRSYALNLKTIARTPGRT